MSIVNETLKKYQLITAAAKVKAKIQNELIEKAEANYGGRQKIEVRKVLSGYDKGRKGIYENGKRSYVEDADAFVAMAKHLHFLGTI